MYSNMSSLFQTSGFSLSKALSKLDAKKPQEKATQQLYKPAKMKKVM
jgi:hypothetical protein